MPPSHTLRLWTAWFLLPLAGLLATAAPLNSGDTNLATVRQTFQGFNIPANASLNFNPVVLFEVTFPEPGGAPPINVTAGELIPRILTAGPPQWALRSNTSDIGPGPFVIAAVDLDPPTPQMPIYSQYRHFLGGGFYFGAERGQDAHALVNYTRAISEFVQPNPQQGSDPHRYVFLVYKESSSFVNQTLVNASTSPIYFNISAFALATGLGDPLGGTFMLVGPGPA